MIFALLVQTKQKENSASGNICKQVRSLGKQQ